MATYTGNLRLTLIADGDESGTWGDTTNDTLNYLDRATGYVSHANSNTDETITISDGSASDASYLYIKVTGTLSAARTITLGPNTLQKLWFIENATSGGYAISMKQGTGAQISVAAGSTAIIHADGAGTGGAIRNAIASLQVTSVVAGTLTLAAGSITDSSGAITFGNENLVTTGTFGSGAATVAALIATTGVFSGILKTDNTTDATSGTDGSLQTDGGLSVAKAIYVGTTAKIIGVTTHGGNVVSDTDSTDDLGTTGVRWANLWVDAITMGGALTASGGGALTGTWSDLGVVTTVDINGGTVGGVTLDGTISGTPTWASNQAITLSTAAQANVTSLGTLTVLQVDNLNVNLNTISATTGAINITPATGSAILLDGTISVDAGVVTGATSITSTAFVGAVTGNASTATALATARAINGVNFDGTAPITVTAAAGTLTGTTLKSTVVTSSLTAVATIATGVWNGTKVASAYLDDDTAHLSGTQTFTGAKTFSAALVASSTLAVTGGVATFGDDVVSDTDSTDDLGTTGVRWANLWVDDVVATTTVKPGTLVLAAGSITDTSGAITFGNENLVTTGTFGAAATTLSSTLTVAGILSVDNTTQTSSGTTGSIHTDGGLGVAKDLFVSGNISLAATSGVYFDGGAHTLIKENSPNVLRCVAGGSGGVDLTSGATSWTSVSDERAKILEEPIIDAMAKLGTLRTVFGTFRDDHQKIRHPLLIAQDVLAVYPEAVVLPEGEDTYRLSYTDMIPLMISGMNETGAALSNAQARIETLEARLEAAGI